MEKIVTRTAEIFKDDDGIIHICILNGVCIDMEDAIDNFLVVRNLSQEEKSIKKLIDGRADWSIDIAAKRFIAGKDVQGKTIARAVVLKSLFKRALCNYFIRLHKIKSPTKIFTDYDAAIKWLKEYKRQ
ncbi:MAG: hypothetical protein HY840_07805 [Bacteroidetes bacterium]|nr:hypothetical protein [Bacteroidota bacterium]